MPIDPYEDALLARWRDGDREAGAELFDRYFENVRHFVERETEENVHHLVECTFLRVLEGPARPRGRSTRAHILAVATDVLRKHMRAAGSERERHTNAAFSAFRSA